MYNVIGRLFDNSEFSEYKKGYGPEMITGMAKVNGLVVGVVANFMGLLMNYPEYKTGAVGMGGKLYRQGLIKMNEFVTLCSRDRLPIIWIQDTSGIDVGNDAEKAELLWSGSIPDLFHPEFQHSAIRNYSEKRFCSCSLRTGRASGQRYERVLHWHGCHGNLCHERRNRCCGYVFQTSC